MGNLCGKIFSFAKGLIKTKITKPFVILGISFIAIVAIIATSALFTKTKREEYAFVSRLLTAIEMDELSTSRLIYNGIAEVYREDGQKIDYHITYKSTVKVGIQVSDIKFDVDHDQKIVRILLPAFTIQSPVVDTATLSFIPENPKIDLKEALAACKDDVRLEAEHSERLIQTAEENLKSIIEALTLPLIKDEGYAIVW